MNTYSVDNITYQYLKTYFGMEFFHREEKGKILIQPVTEVIFRRMQYECGKDKFVFVEANKSKLEYKVVEGGRL